MDEYQIIVDARTKHNLDIKLYPCCGIVELIRYARQIGYNEGYKDAAQEIMNTGRTDSQQPQECNAGKQ